MTIDELRVKDAASLTADEKAFIEANQSDLSADEKTKFGLVTADTKPVTATIDPADAQILADIRSGKLRTITADQAVVDASVLTGLQDTAKQYQTEKAAEVVASHVARGAIKADRAESWTNRLLKADKETRTELEEDLSALPSNESLNQELGSDADPAVFADTRTEIATKAGELIKAAAAEGKTLDYVTAQNQVLASDPQLAERDRNANKF